MDPDPESAADATDGPQLTVSVRPWAHGVVIRSDGELDHDTVGPLREALEATVGEAAGRVVVDFGGLTFCDSTGLNLLLRSQTAAEEAGGSVVLAAVSPMVARMLEITGVQEVFRIYDTVEEALADQDHG